MFTQNERNSELLPELFNTFFGNVFDEPAHRHHHNHPSPFGHFAPFDHPAPFGPAINIIENDADYKVEMAVPGMQKDDFSVKINNEGELVVSVEKKVETKSTDADNAESVTENNASETKEEVAANAAEKAEEPKVKYLRRDFSYSKFTQAFTLPEDVDQTEISAHIADGVLSIELPKKKATEPVDNTRFIEVK